MLKLFFVAALSVAPAPQPAPAAPAQQSQQLPEAPASLWRPAEDHITFTTANIDVPRAAGVVRFTQSFEFSHQGEGIDSGLQFESPDREVFATLYVYYPGLPHAGLTAFMTDQVIHSQSQNLHPLGIRVAAAGGRDGVAIREDYTGFRDGLVSSASFIKVGRWIVKLRVSGPEARRADVDGAMAALLAGLRFRGPTQPRPATPLDVAECGTPSTDAADLLPDDQARAGAMGLIGTFDGAGEEARNGNRPGTTILPARFGAAWCVSTTAHIGQSTYRILRARAPLGTGAIDGTSVIAVPINDAGTTLEAVRTHDHDRVVLLYHEMGATSLLGTYDRAPSDEQIANLLSGADQPGTRFRAVVTLRPTRGANIEIRVPAATPAPAPAPKRQ